MADADQELRELVEFVKEHYSVTSDDRVIFHCACQNPQNCSEWQHHPDIDAVIVQLVQQSVDQDDMQSVYEDIGKTPISLLWLSSNVVWFCVCWKQLDTTFAFVLEDNVFVLLLVNLAWFAAWLSRHNILKRMASQKCSTVRHAEEAEE